MDKVSIEPKFDVILPSSCKLCPWLLRIWDDNKFLLLHALKGKLSFEGRINNQDWKHRYNYISLSQSRFLNPSQPLRFYVGWSQKVMEACFLWYVSKYVAITHLQKHAVWKCPNLALCDVVRIYQNYEDTFKIMTIRI